MSTDNTTLNALNNSYNNQHSSNFDMLNKSKNYKDNTPKEVKNRFVLMMDWDCYHREKKNQVEDINKIVNYIKDNSFDCIQVGSAANGSCGLFFTCKMGIDEITRVLNMYFIHHIIVEIQGGGSANACLDTKFHNLFSNICNC